MRPSFIFLAFLVPWREDEFRLRLSEARLCRVWGADRRRRPGQHRAEAAVSHVAVAGQAEGLGNAVELVQGVEVDDNPAALSASPRLNGNAGAEVP